MIFTFSPSLFLVLFFSLSLSFYLQFLLFFYYSYLYFSSSLCINLITTIFVYLCFIGSTAIVMCIKAGVMFIANVGDSRAVACWSGRADPLSVDHKPSDELEAKRIQAAGGWVEFNRVNGNLALSRALGDFVFKKNENKSVEDQIVTALPDVENRIIHEDLEFVVLACDGIWDVMSNEEVVSFIRTRIAAKMEPAIVRIREKKFSFPSHRKLYPINSNHTIKSFYFIFVNFICFYNFSFFSLYFNRFVRN